MGPARLFDPPESGACGQRRCPVGPYLRGAPTQRLVIVSDGTGQFRVGVNPQCWAHAERLYTTATDNRSMASVRSVTTPSEALGMGVTN